LLLNYSPDKFILTIYVLLLSLVSWYQDQQVKQERNWYPDNLLILHTVYDYLLMTYTLS